MSTLTCKGYFKFKDHAHEFLNSLPGSTVEEAENGYRCLNLFYIGLETTIKLENDLALGMLDLCRMKLTLHRCGLPMWDSDSEGEDD